MSKEAEAREISKHLSGAHSVAFFPLWDSHKERWFRWSILWTKNPTRILDPDEDLAYLVSFGNSIMAEVARLDALLNSQLKDSFLSSISHELRPPLHGVLASVEFLQDSPLNSPVRNGQYYRIMGQDYGAGLW
jgi:signal transduction histidine kinase